MGISKRRAGVALLLLLLALAATADAATGTVTITVKPGGGMVCLGTICKENPFGGDGSGITVFSNVDVDCYHMLNIYGLDGYKPYLKLIYVDSTSSSQTRNVVLELIPAT
ncbi:hypothetical protein, partial [Methanoregula sp.]|uniref:hypothetical protein n=1 Tax=Methanoregula sp. TaxID=2052170 RepID=UPI000CBA8B7F